MSFLDGRNIEEAINTSIIESLRERDAKMCDTWNRYSALGEAYTLRIKLQPDEVEDIRAFAISNSEKTVDIEGVTVKIIALDLRERNDKAVLLVRYRHLKGL